MTWVLWYYKAHFCEFKKKMNLDLRSFSRTRLMVVGDLMLDRYWHGAALRISPEAPIPVVKIGEKHERPGGAGNVALNVRTLGGQVDLLGIVGQDEAGRILEERVQAAGIVAHFQKISSVGTITKLRVMSQNQQLLRLDFEGSFEESSLRVLEEKYLERLPYIDAVILSDYDKGTLSNAAFYIEAARKQEIPIFVDPKGGDFMRYQGATLLTPNLKEFEQIVGPCPSEDILVQKGLQLIRTLDLKALLITRGAQGMTLLRQGQAEFHIPAHVREVYDVTGAGDTVISVLATAIAAGISLPHATALANDAAGIVVGRMGAVSVALPELQRAALKRAGKTSGCMNITQARVMIDATYARGERVVALLGGFDVLTMQDLDRFQQAKTKGENLLVLVYDDESLIQMTEKTPQNTLEHRMVLLAALQYVDWVVSVSTEEGRSFTEYLNQMETANIVVQL